MTSTTSNCTIAVFDVAYGEGVTGVACVLADEWTAPKGRLQIRERVEVAPAAYEPGQFYLRELPLILRVLERLPGKPDMLVVDGYVWLGGTDKPGLGARLFEALWETVPVIGIAKTPFRGDTWSMPVYRGDSRRPLHVTAAGLDAELAAAHVRAMHGAHRIPSLLSEVDRLSRAALAGGTIGT